MNADEYLTLAEPGYAQTRVLGSRFLGSALPVESLDQAMALLEAERKRRFDATHWCWALRTGIDADTLEKSTDAGEPHGTAGIPILGELRKREVTNGLVIVTRYYGGTKLGTGGLVRAYGECASLALDAATVRLNRILAEIRARCPFDDQGIVYAIAHRYQAAVEPVPDSECARFILRCAPDRHKAIADALREEGRGRVIPD